jgi:hypothetical protein
MNGDELRNSGDNPDGLWAQAAADLRAYREAQRMRWGDLDEAALSRFVAGSATEEEREGVLRAMLMHPELRACVETVRDVLGAVRMEELAAVSQPQGRSSQAALSDPGIPDLGRTAARPSGQYIEPGGEEFALGRYRTLRLVGQGSFGRVWLARDDKLDRSVALKILAPERVAGPGDVAAYLAEARALAQLDHPHIVPVHDVGRTEAGLCYVVSGYVEGSDLAALLRRGRPSFRESAELAAVVAEALHYAHLRTDSSS